jgi:hypothetical protein
MRFSTAFSLFVCVATTSLLGSTSLPFLFPNKHQVPSVFRIGAHCCDAQAIVSQFYPEKAAQRRWPCGHREQTTSPTNSPSMPNTAMFTFEYVEAPAYTLAE